MSFRGRVRSIETASEQVHAPSCCPTSMCAPLIRPVHGNRFKVLLQTSTVFMEGRACTNCVSPLVRRPTSQAPRYTCHSLYSHLGTARRWQW